MTHNLLRYGLSCCLFLLLGQASLWAQCANDNTLYNINMDVPNAGDVSTTTCIWGGEYVVLNVTSGVSYTFSTCNGAGFDTQITLYNNSGGTSLDYNDDACGILSEITWTATFTGTLRVLVDRWNCANENTCMRLEITNNGGGGGSSAPANDNCATAISINQQTPGSCLTTSGTTASATQSLAGCAGTADDDVWYSFTATGVEAVVNVVGSASFDAVVEVFSGSCAGPSLACVDNTFTGGTETTTLTGLTVGQVYFIRVYHWSSSPATDPTFTICVTTPGASGTTPNETCGAMAPICTNSGLNFQANANGVIEPGNDYGCLGSQPDPSWYYLEIDNPGPIDFNISAASDVDFALWGPYPNLAAARAACGTLPTPIDCSFSTSNVENVAIPAGQTGEVYILLITNYANIVQNITANQTGGTGTTNCAILTPTCEADAGSW